MNNDSHLPTGARHFFANVCSPPPHGRDKSSPYNTGDKSLHEQFIARIVGAQFHCARGGNGASQKNDAHTLPTMTPEQFNPPIQPPTERMTLRARVKRAPPWITFAGIGCGCL